VYRHAWSLLRNKYQVSYFDTQMQVTKKELLFEEPLFTFAGFPRLEIPSFSDKISC